MHYELIVNGKTKTAQEMNEKEKGIEVIEICPCILGEGPFTAAFWVALGYSATTAAVIATTLTVLVVGIVVAGIVYLLTPIPEIEPREQETIVQTNSFIFQSPGNLAAQGSAVRVGYGRLRVGSSVISQTSKNKNLSEDFDIYAGGSKASSDLDILSRLSNVEIRNLWEQKSN
jgi:predicted phage tail protein